MLALLVFIFSALLLPLAAFQLDPDLPMAKKPPSDRLPTSVRLFKPVTVRDVYLQKSAESLAEDQCGGLTIVHRDIASCNASLPGTYVIPHAAIRHNGEDCGTGRNDEYFLMVPGERLLTAEQARANNLMILYEVLNSNARAKNALDVLNELDPVYVGMELNRPRVCGGQERFPRYTIYFFINVSPGNRDLNFRFAYLGTQELGLVTIKPDEQLCLFKESRNLGPGQSPFATPTPSPSPKSENMTMSEDLYALQNPEGLAACFPIHRLDPSGSPLPQPSIVIAPFENTTPSASPSMNTTSTSPPPSNTTAVVSPSAIPTTSNNTESSPAASPSVASSITPSITPSSNATNESEDNVCFSNGAIVTLESGDKKRMENLRVGDKVLVANSKYSEVFMFTHHTTRIRSVFVRILVSSGDSISMSPSHYIPVSGRLKAARAVMVDDLITLGDGTTAKVVSLRRENLWGLHNPQTIDGTIVVNGILASTFTESVIPSAAVALLAPIKFLYSLGVRSHLLTSTFAHGLPSWIETLPASFPLL